MSAPRCSRCGAAHRSVRTAAAPRARQRRMGRSGDVAESGPPQRRGRSSGTYGQGRRHGVGRRSVMGAAEARGRVEPRSSAVRWRRCRRRRAQGRGGGTWAGRRSGGAEAWGRRRRGVQCRSGYAADT